MNEMDFSQPRRRSRIDSIVPMINIVFLLLIFFLMTATIAPPAPVEVAPPQSTADGRVERQRTLFVAADGRLAVGEARGDAVFDALAGLPQDGPPLLIRADRGVPGARVAEVISRLGTLGLDRVKLIVEGG